MIINPGEECAKRSQELEKKLADFTFEYYRLSEQAKDIANRLRELDLMATDLLASAKINKQAATDFDAYLAAKENAATLEDIQKGAQVAGKDKGAK